MASSTRLLPRAFKPIGRCARQQCQSRSFFHENGAVVSSRDPTLARRWLPQRRWPQKPASGSQSFHNVSAPKPLDEASTRQLYDLTLQLSRTPMDGNAKVQYSLHDGRGTAVRGGELTKVEIAQEYGLSPRDLRSIDLASDGFPHVIIREKTLLFHMFDLRFLVQADRLLLFHSEGTVGSGLDNMWHIFNNNLERKLNGEIAMEVSINLPYELRALEAALSAVVFTLEAEYILIKRKLAEAMQALDRQTKQETHLHINLRTALDLLRSLTSIEQRGRHVRSAIQRVLDDDQDMADMHLSDKQAGRPHALDEHQDVEYLLEAYFKASDAIVNEAASLSGSIQQTEDTIQSILNVRRNEIMVLEAKIEIIMVGLASATLVAGLYGMNVINYFEEAAWAFAILAAMSGIGTVGVWRYGMRQLRRISKVRM